MSEPTFQPEEIVLQKEEFSYGFIIEVLSRGLYPDKHHVLREYIQNSYDAILLMRRRINDPGYGKITVKIDNPSIFIYDDGTGMDWGKINQYRYVGYSEKKTSEGVGFRGIGKLSGISVANKLIITTSPAGIPERYQLIFNADAMLSQIMSLKLKGQNIPLNDLIKIHTSLTREKEEADTHYTMVELHNIKPDSRTLMDDIQIAEYLGMNVPVGFDTNFPYGQIIDGWLREYVLDYDTVPIELNGRSIFKPYLTNLNPPQKGFVYAKDEPGETDNRSSSEQEHLAFYWYCEHSTKGQFEEKDKRGMFFRVKNFAVGTNQLPRMTLWDASPERAFYFWGEIHICDPELIPTSDRGDFEQNGARERFYQSGIQISRTLNTIAGESSSQRRAKEFINKAESVVKSIQGEADEGAIPKELIFNKMFEIQDAIYDVTKRFKDVPEEHQKRAEQVIDSGKILLRQLKLPQVDSSPSTYDIKEKLSFGGEAAAVYEIIIQCIKEELDGQPGLFERLIKRIHTALESRR